MADKEGELLAIRVADGDTAGPQTLAADRFAVQAASHCARGLPAEAAEWDVSQLRIDGQPVSREVVVAWLNVVYERWLDQPLEQQEPPLQATASGLAQLLAFADAVGSSRGVLVACLSHLELLEFSAALGEDQLQLDVGTAYCWFEPPASNSLGRVTASGAVPAFEVGTAAAKAAVVQQVAGQAEELLYLAHRLRLPRLIDAMHDFVKLNTVWGLSSLLRAGGALAAVVTPRVLDAVAGPAHLGQLAFINSLVTERCAFVSDEEAACGPGTVHQVFRPLGLSAQQQEPISFTAELTQDFLASGFKGQRVEVLLDLFRGSTIIAGNTAYPVQLLVGAPVTQDELEPHAVS